MAMTALSPLRDVMSLRTTMDRLFDDAWVGPGSWLTLGRVATPDLPLDVYETPDEFVVRALVPGVKPEAIRRLFSAEKPNPTLTTLVALAGALDLEIRPTPRRGASATRARSAASGTRRRSA